MSAFGQCAQAVSDIPLDRIPAFCASLGERFADGYAAWSLEESTPSPSPELVRSAIDACWSEAVDRALITELSKQLNHDAPKDGQPLFSSKLSLYVVAISLVQEALASRMEPDRSHALRCSEFGLDFCLQLADLRREMAGIGPDYSDPGRDVREFGRDPEAMAECEHQLADAAALSSDAFDVSALRESSSAHGRRVLGSIIKLLHATH